MDRADGHTWLADNAPRQGLAPYYNVLDPRVQEAMLAVAAEVADRYASHASFGGLSVQLSAEEFARASGDEWGFDDQTMANFPRNTKLVVPGVMGHSGLQQEPSS